jgi:hypothetical protein
VLGWVDEKRERGVGGFEVDHRKRLVAKRMSVERGKKKRHQRMSTVLNID